MTSKDGDDLIQAMRKTEFSLREVVAFKIMQDQNKPWMLAIRFSDGKNEAQLHYLAVQKNHFPTLKQFHACMSSYYPGNIASMTYFVRCQPSQVELSNIRLYNELDFVTFMTFMESDDYLTPVLQVRLEPGGLLPKPTIS